MKAVILDTTVDKTMIAALFEEWHTFKLSPFLFPTLSLLHTLSAHTHTNKSQAFASNCLEY